VCEGWETSEGTKKEIYLARENGIPVFFSEDDVKYAINHHGI
jgi:hypothetical protein